MKRLVLAFAYLLASLEKSRPEDCFVEAANEVRTNHFFYSASSDQGAVGDVVGVDFFLTLENSDLELEGVHPNLCCFTLIGCYDPNSLELLDAVRYSDFYDEFAFLSFYYPEGGEAGRILGFPGVFSLSAGILRGATERFLSAGQAFPLLTVYFRVTGEPGAEVQVYPCENKVVGGGCESSKLNYQFLKGPRFFDTRSSRHVEGIIRILSGAATRPEPPPLPPDARVYPEAPTPESAQIRFELEGPSFAQPGATGLPFDLYVTSNFEFSGFMSALRFPARYLEIARVEEHTRPGIVRTDGNEGGIGIVMANGRRRVGAEGERVHLSTLYFNVKESAEEASQLELRFEAFENFFNWLAIYHQQGLNPDALPVSAEVSPLFVTHALLRVQTRPTRLGDANLDYALDISDAVVLLNHLFVGGVEFFCSGAADFNGDGRVNISDPIAILTNLFRGGGLHEGEVFCN